jgi:hypothetical protein
MRWNKHRRGFYTDLLLCPEWRWDGVFEHCITITLLLPWYMKGQHKSIPSPSWLRASGVLLGVPDEVRGTGEGAAWLRAREARKGFPDDMMGVMYSALSQVPGMCP